ncbi:integral membrane protein [Ilyonectria robusta]
MVTPILEPPVGQKSDFDNPDRDMYNMFACILGHTVYATMVIYGPTVFAIKAAIALFIARIFEPYRTYVKWIYGFLSVMAIYYIIMLFLKMLICRPISRFWDPSVEGECFNQRALILTDNVISLFSDVVVLLLPCPLTKKLQVGLWAKIKIAAAFSAGGIACIFGLIRLVFIVKDGTSPDQTYVFVKINLTGIAECGIGIICACLPLMPMLWKSILQPDKPLYASNVRSRFEMMTSSQQKSGSTTNTHTNCHYPSGTESDENILIGNGKAQITAQVQVDRDSSFTETNNSEGDGKKCKGSLDEVRIYRTVEIHQYEER